MKAKIIVCIVVVSLLSANLLAEPMEVKNFSFELLNGSPVTVKTMGATPDDWFFASGNDDDGIENPSSEGEVCAAVGTSSPDSIYQLTEHTIAAGDEYTLTFDTYFLWGPPSWDATYQGRLYYDDAGTRVPIDYVEGSSVFDWAWHTETITVAIGSGSPAVGKKLGIDLYAESPIQSWVGFDNVIMEGELGGSVKALNPANGATNVPVATILEWGPPTVYTPEYYDLYFGDDANELSPHYYANTPVLDKQNQTTWDPPGDLDNDTPYYWRVDAYEPNTPEPIRHIGNEWTFRTVPPLPVIDVEPESTTVEVGQTATFSLTALNATLYEWFKVGDPDISMGSGATMDTLEITNVQLGDEGQYYCTVSNSEGSVDSVIVSLWTKRLMGWWKLDNNGTDSVALEVTGAPTHDAALPVDPNFSTDGIDNQSYEFFGDSGRIIVIPGTSDFFNFYPLGYTVSAWVKNPNSGWGGIAGKQNEARTPDYGWVLNHNGDTAYSTLRQTPSGDYGANVGLLDGQWHLVVGMFDAELGQVRFYADGVLAAQSGEGITGISGSDVNMCIGAESTDGASPLSGLVDDVRIWSYPLDPITIGLLYTDLTGESVCVNQDDAWRYYDVVGEPGESSYCRVDIEDFAELATVWMECNLVPDCLP